MTFGKLLNLTTYGESHGVGIGGILEGVPSNIPLTEEDIQPYLDKRKPGKTPYTSSRKESDTIQILSGVFQGKTTGTPIGFHIQNIDANSNDYTHIKHAYRPGHADITYHHKYKNYDYRGSGRASGRETAIRVAAGAVARKILPPSVKIIAAVTQIGTIKATQWDSSIIENNPFRSADHTVIPKWEKLVQQAIQDETSWGSEVTIIAQGIPIGWGEPVFDKLSADLAKALMGIGGVKGIAIGDGWDVVSQQGHEHNDPIQQHNNTIHFQSNHAGGILGGISNGEDIILKIAIKPPSSIGRVQKTINHTGENITIQTKGRHDPCLGMRIVPVAEAMVALTLADHFLRQQAQRVRS